MILSLSLHASYDEYLEEHGTREEGIIALGDIVSFVRGLYPHGLDQAFGDLAYIPGAPKALTNDQQDVGDLLAWGLKNPGESHATASVPDDNPSYTTGAYLLVGIALGDRTIRRDISATIFALNTDVADHPDGATLEERDPLLKKINNVFKIHTLRKKTEFKGLPFNPFIFDPTDHPERFSWGKRRVKFNLFGGGWVPDPQPWSTVVPKTLDIVRAQLTTGRARRIILAAAAPTAMPTAGSEENPAASTDAEPAAAAAAASAASSASRTDEESKDPDAPVACAAASSAASAMSSDGIRLRLGKAATTSAKDTD